MDNAIHVKIRLLMDIVKHVQQRKLAKLVLKVLNSDKAIAIALLNFVLLVKRMILLIVKHVKVVMD